MGNGIFKKNANYYNLWKGKEGVALGSKNRKFITQVLKLLEKT